MGGGLHDAHKSTCTHTEKHAETHTADSVSFLANTCWGSKGLREVWRLQRERESDLCVHIMLNLLHQLWWLKHVKDGCEVFKGSSQVSVCVCVCVCVRSHRPWKTLTKELACVSLLTCISAASLQRENTKGHSCWTVKASHPEKHLWTHR